MLQTECPQAHGELLWLSIWPWWRKDSADLLSFWQSTRRESIPYMSGGVVFLGHSLYFPSSSSNSIVLILSGISMPPTITNTTQPYPVGPPSQGFAPEQTFRCSTFICFKMWNNGIWNLETIEMIGFIYCDSNIVPGFMNRLPENLFL